MDEMIMWLKRTFNPLYTTHTEVGKYVVVKVGQRFNILSPDGLEIWFDDVLETIDFIRSLHGE